MYDLPRASPGDNINERWNQWTSHLLNTMEKSIPSTIKSSTPWIDCNIQLAVSKRERLYRKFKCSNWLYKYRSLRNKVIYMIRSAKKFFFESLVSPTKDPKKFWSTVKSVHPKRTLHGSLTNGAPHLKKDSLLIENVQLFAARMATKCWRANASTLNETLNLPTINSRRKYFSMLLYTLKWLFILS